MLLFSFLAGLATAVLVSFKLNAFSSISTIYIPLLLWLGFFLAYIGIILLCLLIISLFLPKKSPDKPNKFAYFWVKVVVGFILQVFRVKVHVKNGELIEGDKAYLLVSNHRSKFDPILQFKVFERCNPVMISKPENFKIPLAGPFLNNAGCLAIDRNNDREALKTIIKASKFLKEQNLSIGVCPEGTRNLKDRNLMPLKAGSLKIATKAKAPIAVMVFEGTEKIGKKMLFKTNHVYINVLKIITYEEYQDKSTQELAEDISKIIQTSIDNFDANNF